MTNPLVLQIEEMQISRGQGNESFRVILPHLSLDAGQVVALTGPSGCGKSTLLECIGLLLKPDHVRLHNLKSLDLLDSKHESSGIREKFLAQVRGNFLGFVPQTGGLLPFLSVQGNIDLPNRMLGKATSDPIIEMVIDRLGLRPLLERSPSQLSIGERQRVSFARAVAHSPALLLADEPTAALDPDLAKKIIVLMMEVVRELDISALIVSHEWSILSELGIGRIAGIPHGERATVFDGSPR